MNFFTDEEYDGRTLLLLENAQDLIGLNIKRGQVMKIVDFVKSIKKGDQALKVTDLK